MEKQTKVLIVDDSPIVREILSQGLSQDSGIEVVGTAEDVYQARDMIIKLRPDVVTLDIEMPRMDGLEFLRRLMPQYPIPVIVVSSLTHSGQETTLKALSLGAVDFMGKPSSRDGMGLNDMLIELATKIKIASTANVSHWKNSQPQQTQRSKNPYSNKNSSKYKDNLIAIGASTGGTEAITRVITELPNFLPCIVIVQHMPAGFTKTFAKRLNDIAYFTVKEAQTGDPIVPGVAYIAPGDHHLKVVKSGEKNSLYVYSGEKINGHRPSIDPMMFSVAEIYKEKALGVILTGMGSDGSKGLLAMKNNGAKTIGQDEESSIVYGMPKVASEIGAIDVQLPLDNIALYLTRKFPA